MNFAGRGVGVRHTYGLVEKETNMSLKVKVDALIIGAGIMGTSCAFRLSECGLRVAVLEAQISPAMGSTGRSTAGVRVQFTEEVNIRLSWESIQEYQHFQDLSGVDSGYRAIGYLLLVPPERLEVHMASVRFQERLGVPVRMLSVEEAHQSVRFAPAPIAWISYGPAAADDHSPNMTFTN